MTDDLTTRLLAAIEATEKIAQLAVNHLNQVDWVSRPSKHPLGQYEAAVDAGRNITIRIGTNPLSCDASDLAAHIATKHPKATLRHCAAHRKIVELHGREVEPHWNRGQRHDYAVCSGCFTGVGTGERVAFPCDTLVALAEAYDLTTEPAP